MDSNTLNLILAIANSIMAIGAILSLIFIGSQVVQVKKQISSAKQEFITQNNRQSMERAINLSRYYQEEIIPLQTILFNVFERVGIAQELKVLDEKKMVKFDYEELSQLASDELKERYFKKLKSKEVADAFRDFQHTLCQRDNMNIQVECKESFDDEKKAIIEETIIKEVSKTSSIQDINSFNAVIIDLLNKLEYFSMNFACNIADEEVLYHSLQQTYRSTVKYLYIKIAHTNRNLLSKYFVQTIHLYNIWNNKYISNSEKVANQSNIQKDELYAIRKFDCKTEN